MRRRWTSGLYYTQEPCGLTLPLNRCSLESLSKNLGTTRGWLDNNETKWWQQDATCLRCPRRVTYKSGIICANYGHRRGPFQPCRAAYYGTCFEPHELDRFEVKIPQDFHGDSRPRTRMRLDFEWREEEITCAHRSSAPTTNPRTYGDAQLEGRRIPGRGI